LTEVSTKPEAEHTATSCCKQEKIPTRKEVTDAWVGVVILNIIFGALFPYVWWAWIPRVVVTIHAIELTVRYAEAKKANEKTLITPVKTEIALATPVITEPLNVSSSMFCPNCGVQLNSTTKFCPYCGNAL